MGFADGHIARVTLTAQLGDDQVVNTLHYDMHDGTPGLGNGTLQGLADRLADDLMDPWGALFPAAWTIQPVIVMDEKDPQNPLAVRDGAVSGAPQAGTGGAVTTDNLAPLEECVVATLRTGHIGRRFRGRIFLPPIFDENATSGGLLASGKASQYQTFLNAIPLEPDIVTGESDSTTVWSIYSRTQRAANLDPYATPIETVQLQTRLRWLRSRGA